MDVAMPAIDRQTTFSGTKEVAGVLAIDAARLETYLAANAAGFTGPLSVKQFKGGQSNPTYMLETPARKYVLRRKPPGKLLPSAHAVDREFRVISALHAQGFPVPTPVLFCDEAGIVGTPFYVMSHVDGRVIWEPHIPDAEAGERAAVYDAMNATLARLHALDPAALGLADFGRGENYVGRQVERWSKQYRASEIEKIDEMERLMAWLPAHLPPPAPVRLVHGDYRLDNIILSSHGPDILAVLDWELSTLGDPLADLAYHLMQWHMPRLKPAPVSARCSGMILAASGFRRGQTMWTPTWRVPASIRGPIWRSISPTISSAWRRSCRASPVVRATAPPPARLPPTWRRWCARSPPRPGILHARRAHDDYEPSAREDLCARAWRGRSPWARPYRSARSARRDGQETGRHRRNVNRLVDRRRLCRRDVRQADPALCHQARPQPRGRVPPAHRHARGHVRRSVQHWLWQRHLGRCGKILPAVHARRRPG